MTEPAPDTEPLSPGGGPSPVRGQPEASMDTGVNQKGCHSNSGKEEPTAGRGDQKELWEEGGRGRGLSEGPLALRC